MPQRMLTLVVPCLNEADGIGPFLSRCAEVELACPAYQFDYLFVDDGSTDATWEQITRLAAENARVRGLRLARNYGQQRAISAGLDACDADAVAILDADLQDPPELLKEMLAAFEAGADVVHAVRVDRESDAAFKRLSAKLFYAVMRRWVLPSLPENAGDFKLISRRALEAYRAYGERVRFLRGIFATLGFQQATVRYTRPARTTGHSKYPLRRMLRLARDAVFSNTALPLRWCTYSGCIALALWPVVVVSVALRAPSTIAFLLLAQWLFSALLLMGVGLAGEYFKIIVLEVKSRPLYLVRDSINLK
ncbi:MAG: hypothetical protein RLZZ303_1933 [Candidatus Hydrogenedentota bacterium]